MPKPMTFPHSFNATAMFPALINSHSENLVVKAKAIIPSKISPKPVPTWAKKFKKLSDEIKSITVPPLSSSQLARNMIHYPLFVFQLECQLRWLDRSRKNIHTCNERSFHPVLFAQSFGATS